MNTSELIEAISAKDVDVAKFAQLAIDDAQLRDDIITQMMEHPHIMVYYHCYYVADKASQQRPALFYAYWHQIALLLRHKNSYHRDFALTIIANLTQVDQDNLFDELFDAYFEHINDAKFMTGQCCVQNSGKILKHKPELRERIIHLLLDMDNRCTYTEKQLELLKCDVLEALESVYEEIDDRTDINALIKASVTSISPKMRRKAKKLVAKHGL